MTRLIIVLLCLAGVVVSWRMAIKSKLAEQGKVREKSVVKTRRARLFGGIPNSQVGLAYYPLLIVATPFLQHAWIHRLALAAAVAAALTSIYLAYSLLFVTRMQCINCWISHVVNWLLVVLVWIA